MACDTAAYLYDRYGAGLYGYALTLLAEGADAEDVVQEVFAKFYARSQTGWSADIPEHYLFRAVRNESFSRLRRRRLFALWQERNKAITPLLAPNDAYAEERERLDAALRALSVKQREIVVLKVFESMSFSAIASVLGISANTAASRYRYAVVKLRSLLDPEDFQR